MFWFSAIFLFFECILGPKMDQNSKLWVRPIWAKIVTFESFLKHCYFIIIECLWWKFHHHLTMFGGVRAPKPRNNSLFMAAALKQNHPFLKTTIKTMTYLVHDPTLPYWSNVQANLATFWGVLAKKPPKSSLKRQILLRHKR